MSRILQTRRLPDDWLEQVFEFDLNLFGTNEKLIAEKLVKYIENNKEISLQSPLIRKLVLYVVFNQNDFLSYYNAIPEELFKDAINELGGQKGFQFDSKLHSIFVELLTYKKLTELGYIYSSHVRHEGSCDLIMRKDCVEHHFEVKFKESPDIGLSRLFYFLEKFTFFDTGAHLRGKNIEIRCLDKITYRNLPKIQEEIKLFVESQEEFFKGEYVDIFPAGKYHLISKDINSRKSCLKGYVIEETSIESLINIYTSILVGDGKHLTRLKEKYTMQKTGTNLHGFLSLIIPFHLDTSCDQIQTAIKQVCEKEQICFPLHVLLSGYGTDECYFCVNPQ